MGSSMKAACIIVQNPQGKVLAIQSPRGLTLPGGKLEPGETFAQGALRELWEETGLEAVLIPQSFYVDDVEGTQVVCFMATQIGGDLRPEPGRDVTLDWVFPQVLGAPNAGAFAEYNRRAIHALLGLGKSL